MASETAAASTPSLEDLDRILIIVARDRPELWDYMAYHYAEFPRLQVIRDRRQGDRRRLVQPHAPELRRANRRQAPGSQPDCGAQAFVIVHQEHDPLAR
jgi:hypothetical protein